MSADESREHLAARLRAVIEWVSGRDHGQAVELDEVVHELEVAVRADALVEQANFKGMTVEEGAVVLELGPPRALIIAWVDTARKMLGDAPNYSETRIDFPKFEQEIKAAGEFERYVFTVQRAGKLTPHEARRQAEAERDAVVAAHARCDSLVRPVLVAALAYADSTAEPTDTPHEDALLDAVNAYRAAVLPSGGTAP